MSIEEKIRDFVLNNLYFAESSAFENDASFLEEGVIDSMGSIELVAYVEAEFGIKVEMAEVVVKNFDSVQKLANFVRRKLGQPESLSTTTLAVLPALAGEKRAAESIPQSSGSETSSSTSIANL